MVGNLTLCHGGLLPPPPPLSPPPSLSLALSFPDDPTKWLTRVTSSIDSDEPLTMAIPLPGSECCRVFRPWPPFPLHRSLCCFSSRGAGAIKKGIISRQSTCLPLHSSSIKLVQSITWAYWSESSAAERAVCKINALFSPRLAMFMLVFLFFFLFVFCSWKWEENKGETIYFHRVSSLALTLVSHIGVFSLVLCHLSGPRIFPSAPYLHHIYEHESTSL